ncbi:MAG: hypothetical protein AAFY15_02150 [Cyanobacteria bacterium J06648_11]
MRIHHIKWVRGVSLSLASLLVACSSNTVPTATQVDPSGDRVTAVFQGDPATPSSRDAALILAFANLPGDARTPENLAAAARSLLLDPEIEVAPPNPTLTTANIDFAWFVNEINMRDVAVAIAAIGLENPTKAAGVTVGS